MSLLAQIKTDQLQSRRNKDSVKTALLTTLLGDINTATINGKVELTDAEVCKIVKKFLNGVNIFIEMSPNKPELYVEKEILESYLPVQLTTETLTKVVEDIVAANPGAVMGLVMKELKAKYEGLYEGSEASGIIKAKLKAQ